MIETGVRGQESGLEWRCSERPLRRSLGTARPILTTRISGHAGGLVAGKHRSRL